MRSQTRILSRAFSVVAPALGVALGVSLGCGGVAPSALAQTPGFHLTGSHPGTNTAFATCVSADGSVVGGYSADGQGFVWSESTGRYDLNNEPVVGLQRILAISGDGTTVTGTGSLAAFRWRGPGTYQSIGRLPGYQQAEGRGVSGDGSVVVGVSEDSASSSRRQAFRWTPSGGMQGLGFAAPGHNASEATGITRDGGTIVGWSRDSGSGRADAVKWTSAGVQVLPAFGPQFGSEAAGVSGSGSYIVGYDATIRRAVMWTDAGIQNLGVAPGWSQSNATGVSDDGTVVVGRMISGLQSTASVWTPSTGMVTLTDYLASNGLTVPAGWTLGSDFAVSGNGRTFVGKVTIPGGGVAEAIAITIPGPGGFAVLLALTGMTFARQRFRR